MTEHAPSPESAPPRIRSQHTPWLTVAVPVALVGLAAALVFLRLGSPSRIFFDETYYVNDARDYLRMLVEGSFAVHPPVGKWLIAAGIELFGDNGFGWRALGALGGALGVLLTYLTARRLFRRLWPAALAGLLVATDGLWIAQAHTAMLDIHLGFFVALGAWLLVVDRDRTRAAVDAAADRDGDEAVAALGHRHGFRALAGVAFGLAVATKWSGALALIAGGIVVLGWELALRRRIAGRRLVRVGALARSFALTLVVVPVAVYALTWIPWLVGFADSSEADDVCGDTPVAECELGTAERVGGLVSHHREVIEFHLTLDATHSYRAPAYTWPVLGRPVVYYWETCTEERFNQVETTGEDGEVSTPEPCRVDLGEAAEILNVGNPALWWAFLPATVLLGAGLGRRDGRAGFIVAFWGLQFAPWLLVSRPAFLFYMVPVVPFLALGVAYAALAVEERRRLLWPAVWAAAGAVVGALAGFGLEHVTTVRTPDGHWVGLGLGWLAGALLAGIRGRSTGDTDRPRSRAGRIAAAVLAVTAVVLLVYFYPVWTGLPLEESAVRARWWFESWI